MTFPSLQSLAHILDPEAVGAAIPPAFARYRRAVAEGLAFFLMQLDPARLVRIQVRLAALPAETTTEARLAALASESPVLHKLAQVLARDRRLPPSLRELFQHLETMPASVGASEVRTWIEAEIGPLDGLGLKMDGAPLAEASVAMVSPFVTAAGERFVFKILKPGVETALMEDLDALEATGTWLDERCQELGLPEIAYAATFGEVARLLRREVRLDQEQQNLALALDLYRGAPSVVIPNLHPVCTPRLTAMSRLDGRKVTEIENGPASQTLARLMGDALVARPLWSQDELGTFHADPHAGNLMVTPDGRLGILDWALAGRLDKRERVLLIQILIGALTLKPTRIAAAIEALSHAPLDPGVVDRRIRQSLDDLSHGTWPGMSWLSDLLDGVAIHASGTFSADLILFRKSVLTLEGVMADVCETARLDDAIAGRLLSQLTAEAGPRFLAHPLWRGFGSHLSNHDLAEIMLTGPIAAWRSWLRG